MADNANVLSGRNVTLLALKDATTISHTTALTEAQASIAAARGSATDRELKHVTEIGNLEVERMMAEFTTYDKGVTERIPTHKNVGELNLTMNYISADVGFQRLETSYESGTADWYALVYRGQGAAGQLFTFQAFVRNFNKTNALDSQVSVEVSLTITGDVMKGALA